jgi:hypothetical protein
LALFQAQHPTGSDVYLDHVGWFVADLNEAAVAMQRLGFVVSPENIHTNQGPDGGKQPSGTMNRLVTPGQGYLEFLAARGDTPLSMQHAKQLARYQGLHLLAFSSSDVPAEAPRLAEEGFRPLEPVDMRRDVEIEEGVAEGRFSVLRVPPDAMPEGRMQWCGHLTPELVGRESLTIHPNSAVALTGTVWVVEDLVEVLDRYHRFVRMPAMALADGIGVVELDRGSLIFATADAARNLLPDIAIPTLPFGACVMVRVENLGAAAWELTANGVQFEEEDNRILVPPSEALGAWLILHTGDQPFSFNTTPAK